MLGTEPQVIEEFVQSGKVKIVFWPVLNHGNPSVYSTIAAHCVGAQDPEKFWDIHEMLFSEQGSLYGADRDYYVNAAVSAGADQPTFESCYDDPASLEAVLRLDDLRRERGINGQPYFDIAGTIYGGAPTFEQFAEVLGTELGASGS